MKVISVLGGWLGGKRPQAFLAVAVFLFISSNSLWAQTVTVNGSQVFQTIEGFGVNVNHRSWTNNELQPVLDAFIDQAGMTLFRVIWDNTDWEGVNDNADPNVMNWGYYNPIYSAPEFQQLWGIMGYLNQRGITNGVIVNFQGPGPVWLGGTNYLIAGYENEWAEMIASLFVYARNTQHLQFSLIAPDNEPDCYMGIYGSEGVRMTFYQYPTALHHLAQQLDSNGLSDVRFVAPDAQSSASGYLWQMMTDPVVMARMACRRPQLLRRRGWFGRGTADPERSAVQRHDVLDDRIQRVVHGLRMGRNEHLHLGRVPRYRQLSARSPDQWRLRGHCLGGV